MGAFSYEGVLLGLQLRNIGLNIKPLLLGEVGGIEAQLIDNEMAQLTMKQLGLLLTRSPLLLRLQLLPVLLLPLQLFVLLLG